MRSQVGSLILCAAILAGPAARADTVIEPVAPSGDAFEPNTDLAIRPLVLGETIKVPTDGDTDLVSFGFAIFQPPPAVPVGMVAYVYAWNGSEATGPALYTSPLTPINDNVDATTPPYGPYPIFETGGLNLIAGQEYVIFVDAENSVYLDYLMTSDGNAVGGPDSNGNYTVTTQNADPSLWTTEAWSIGGIGDFQFQTNYVATFAAPVPEPSTWIMALAGLGSLGLIRLATRKGGAQRTAAVRHR
jgi:PEP-CTERM motif